MCGLEVVEDVNIPYVCGEEVVAIDVCGLE